MPGYLLRADAPDMTRWKAAAADSGQSFAEFARAAINNATSDPVAFAGQWTNVGGKFVPDDMVVLSTSCYRNIHRGCSATGCECGCHEP